MTIGITAATGQLGYLVAEHLKTKVSPSHIIALVRTPAKAAGLGIEAREFDYSRPDMLLPSLAGIDTLLLISSSEVGQRAVQHRNVIEAAKNSGVRRVVYTSLLHAENSPLSLAQEHRTTEEALRSSGIPFTILRNGWYTENYTSSVSGALAAGALLGSAGDGRISSATRADYAEAAAAVLTSQGHAGKTYELAGDEAYTLADLAAEISRQTGKTIPYRNLPEVEYARALVGFGLPENAAKAYASFDTGASIGALFDDGRQLSALIGRPTTPLKAAVADALRKAT